MCKSSANQNNSYDNAIFFPPPLFLPGCPLSLSARLLYGVIFTHAMATGCCTDTNWQLAKFVRISSKRASALVSELVRHKYLKRIVVRDDKTGEVIRRELIPLVK